MTTPEKYPLRMPIWHIPYLEKHRIYELFQELAKELIIQQPADHMMFLKQILLNASRSREVARVILICSPRVNFMEVAKGIAKITKQVVITESTLVKCSGRANRSELTPPLVAKLLSYLVRTENAYLAGWIMVDCIRDEKEAKALLKLGILPTHVIHLIPPFYPNLNELLYCNVPLKWPEYRRRITSLRAVYHNKLKEIYVQHRNLPEIISDCVETIRIRPGLDFIKPRVLLIGPRGSGRKSQAKLLGQNLNLVHVDFEYLICQAWMSETELGEKLRACRREVCFHSELLAQVINKRILEPDCLNNGWVLTGYPYTITDMKYIDSLDTPPNRVIFLECELTVCKERLFYRRMNAHTASYTYVMDKDTPEEQQNEEKTLKLHPKDSHDVVEAELNFYCENYGNLRKYCGATASTVNADQCERWVYECITAIITRAAPSSPSRKGLADMGSLPSVATGSVCGCMMVPSKVMDCFIRKL